MTCFKDCTPDIKLCYTNPCVKVTGCVPNKCPECCEIVQGISGSETYLATGSNPKGYISTIQQTDFEFAFDFGADPNSWQQVDCFVIDGVSEIASLGTVTVNIYAGTTPAVASESQTITFDATDLIGVNFQTIASGLVFSNPYQYYNIEIILPVPATLKFKRFCLSEGLFHRNPIYPMTVNFTDLKRPQISRNVRSFNLQYKNIDADTKSKFECIIGRNRDITNLFVIDKLDYAFCGDFVVYVDIKNYSFKYNIQKPSTYDLTLNLEELI